jgi:dTDP-glucose pyrophosphorylase
MQRAVTGLALTPAQAEAAALGIKGMIPDSRGRPFLDHVLSSLADAGIEEVCLVIRPEHGVVRSHYAERPPRRVTLTYVEQPEARGTANAMLHAEAWAGDREFLALNSDNLYPDAALTGLVQLDGPGLVAFERDTLLRESNIEPERVAAFAVISITPDDILSGIVEKPDLTKTTPAQAAWISMNLWRFDRMIFEACRDVPLSPRGEFELPLAVGLGISRGMNLRVVRVSAGVLDLSSRGDIARVAQTLGDHDINP